VSVSHPARPDEQAEPAHPVEFGACVTAEGARFAVWAPRASRVDLDIAGGLVPMAPHGDGVWEGFVPGAAAGLRYLFRLDDAWSYPDPYSRSQPDGPHGRSEVIDTASFAWTDDDWRGIDHNRLVIYELHVGIHTPEGTFDALIADLDVLRELGITAIELLPIADFPGERNWGYDGVNLFAPSRNYGGPAGLQRLVDAAHSRGIAVILDVVYNHLGPDGNYLLQYSPDYLTNRYSTPWGDAVNFDGPNSDRVRRYVLDNVRYWLREFHIDGLRLDATFSIYDSSPRHILGELTSAARESVDRSIVLIAETYENDARYVRPESDGGLGFDAVWVDDFHHVVHTAASHDYSGYYRDYGGTMEELATTINRGWLFQGEYSGHHGTRRGTTADDLPATSFVYFIQNHDQVGNHAFGRRFSHLVGASAKRPWSALGLLLPYTPMIFAGEEFVSSSRFFYFTDHHGALGQAVTEGRRAEYARLAGEDTAIPDTPDPQALETFLDSKLDLTERRRGVGEQIFRMYGALLALRREDAVLSRRDRHAMKAMAVSPQLLLVHLWHGREHRLIAVNQGTGLDAAPRTIGIPDELCDLPWAPLFSTDERRFGGIDDTMRFDTHLVSMPPQTLVLLASSEPSARDRLTRRVRGLVERLRAAR
jgi:maltooligosyltrehalose trehalohydrolase